MLTSPAAHPQGLEERRDESVVNSTPYPRPLARYQNLPVPRARGSMCSFPPSNGHQLEAFHGVATLFGQENFDAPNSFQLLSLCEIFPHIELAVRQRLFVTPVEEYASECNPEAGYGRI